MNSLVGYTVDSDSEDDEDGDDVNDSVTSRREVGDAATVDNKTRNLLLECGSASSESDSVSEGEGDDIEPSSTTHPSEAASAAMTSAPSHPTMSTLHLSSLTTTTTTNKLPPPPLYAHSDSSVFANPFKAKVDQKLNALQKHVPLTMQAKPSQIGGRRMCVAYRKDGRCRFGIKCKFAHDSDLQTSVIPSDLQPPVDNETPGSEQADPHTGRSPAGGSQTLSQEGELEETDGLKGRKRRVGVSNTLIPPKKAMKQYTMQRNREHLHMS